MSNEDIIKLAEQSFNPSLYEKYKEAYNIVYAPMRASNCNCNSQALYNNLRQKLNELKTKNPTQTKNPESGKFESVKTVVTIQPETIKEDKIEPRTSVDYILEVRQNLYDGYLDPEKILKAYRLIAGDSDAISNLRVMKLAIINYVQPTK
jgi:hypothetical protein